MSSDSYAKLFSAAANDSVSKFDKPYDELMAQGTETEK